MDIGGTKILGVLLDGKDQVVARSRAPTPQVAGPGGSAFAGVAVHEVVDALLDVVSSLDGGPDCPLGIGAPGMIDREGRIRFSPNLPGIVGADLRHRVAAHLPGCRVTAVNDATCAAHAEHTMGSGKGVDNLVLVTLGTGIGGGLIVHGELVLGRSGFAGEIGHMVVDPNGPPCPCGGRGCWERFASGGGLGRMARDAATAGLLPEVVALAGDDPEAVRGEHVTEAATLGDAGAQQVLEEVGGWLGLGLANLSAALDPERIVVGGGLIGAGENLLEPARRAFARLVEGGGARPPVSIVSAAFGEESGAVGAALLAGDVDRR